MSGPVTIVRKGGAFTKSAGGYKLNDFAASVDGGAVVTDVVSAIPAGLDIMHSWLG